MRKKYSYILGTGINFSKHSSGGGLVTKILVNQDLFTQKSERIQFGKAPVGKVPIRKAPNLAFELLSSM